MNPDFKALHRQLVVLMHPASPAIQKDPVISLGERVREFTKKVEEGGSEGPLPSEVELRRERLSAVDQAMVDLLVAGGWAVPETTVRLKSASRLSRVQVSAQLKMAPRIALSVDDTGRTRPLAPETGESWKSFPSRESWAHWATLFHEVAHGVFSRLPRPFVSDRLPPAVVEDMNAFLLGPLANARGFFHRVLNESFADVYAAMLLETMAPDHPGVLQEIKNLTHARRWARQEDFDPSLSRRELVFSLPHLTDMALEKMASEKEQWSGLPPLEMRLAAQRFASEGLLALVAPGRWLVEDSVRLDDRLIKFLKKEFNEFLSEGPLVSMVAHAVSTPGRSRLSYWKADLPAHPAFPVMETLVAKLNPGQKSGAELYPALDAERRHIAIATFLERGLKTRGHALRDEVSARAETMASALLALAPVTAPVAAKSPGF